MNKILVMAFEAQYYVNNFDMISVNDYKCDNEVVVTWFANCHFVYWSHLRTLLLIYSRRYRFRY